MTISEIDDYLKFMGERWHARHFVIRPNRGRPYSSPIEITEQMSELMGLAGLDLERLPMFARDAKPYVSEALHELRLAPSFVREMRGWSTYADAVEALRSLDGALVDQPSDWVVGAPRSGLTQPVPRR